MYNGKVATKRWQTSSPVRATRWGLTLLFGMMLLLGLTGPVLAQVGSPAALVLDVDGVINPVKERYIERALQAAADTDAPLVIIRLDTPGGLMSSTREIVEMLLEADTPTVVYVSPRGAQAGSAGTFLTAAANFAVMAPSTNIGAATPVSATGQELDETLANKVTNDASALIRSIADERGRNGEKLEDTVRKGASFTASEAVDLNLVDFVATNLDNLLAQLHGREVTTRSRTWTLDTNDLLLQDLDKNPLEHFLEFIANPDVAFLLLTLGGLGIVVELFNPGLIAPGVVGAILLILAFLALGNLPVNWAGVVLIALALALAVLETQVAGFGVLGVGSIICLVLGGFLLFAQFGTPSPTLPPISVSPWLLAATAVTLGAGLFYLVWVIRKSRAGEKEDSSSHMLGRVGTVITELAPRGVVRLGDGNWTAESDNDTVIPVGGKIIVIGINDLILTVIPFDEMD